MKSMIQTFSSSLHSTIYNLSLPILIDFRFLYEDESEIDDANIFEVLYAAFYFKLDPLESECVKVLQDKVTVENVWLMLKEAI